MVDVGGVSTAPTPARDDDSLREGEPAVAHVRRAATPGATDRRRGCGASRGTAVEPAGPGHPATSGLALATDVDLQDLPCGDRDRARPRLHR